eukprot:2673251-Amphidinium_carterae.1
MVLIGSQNDQGHAGNMCDMSVLSLVKATPLAIFVRSTASESLSMLKAVGTSSYPVHEAESHEPFAKHASRPPAVVAPSVVAVLALLRSAIAGASGCDFVDAETVTKVRNGWSGFGPGKQWCNRCTCHEGRLGCLKMQSCPPARNCTLSDDTSVPHGWKGHDVAYSWCKECSCYNSNLACTDMTCGPPAETDITCKLGDGTEVESGWSGKDTGRNYCNTCRCNSGPL